MENLRKENQLIETFINSQSTIPVLVYMKMQLMQLVNDKREEKELLIERLEALKSQLISNKKNISHTLKLAGIPETGQYFWAGGEIQFYTGIFTDYVRQFLKIKEGFSAEGLAPILKQLSLDLEK